MKKVCVPKVEVGMDAMIRLLRSVLLIGALPLVLTGCFFGNHPFGPKDDVTQGEPPTTSEPPTTRPKPTEPPDSTSPTRLTYSWQKLPSADNALLAIQNAELLLVNQVSDSQSELVSLNMELWREGKSQKGKVIGTFPGQVESLLATRTRHHIAVVARTSEQATLWVGTQTENETNWQAIRSFTGSSRILLAQHTSLETLLLYERQLFRLRPEQGELETIATTKWPDAELVQMTCA